MLRKSNRRAGNKCTVYFAEKYISWLYIFEKAYVYCLPYFTWYDLVQTKSIYISADKRCIGILSPGDHNAELACRRAHKELTWILEWLVFQITSSHHKQAWKGKQKCIALYSYFHPWIKEIHITSYVMWVVWLMKKYCTA